MRTEQGRALTMMKKDLGDFLASAERGRMQNAQALRGKLKGEIAALEKHTASLLATHRAQRASQAQTMSTQMAQEAAQRAHAVRNTLTSFQQQRHAQTTSLRHTLAQAQANRRQHVGMLLAGFAAENQQAHAAWFQLATKKGERKAATGSPAGSQQASSTPVKGSASTSAQPPKKAQQSTPSASLSPKETARTSDLTPKKVMLPAQTSSGTVKENGLIARKTGSALDTSAEKTTLPGNKEETNQPGMQGTISKKSDTSGTPTAPIETI